MKNKLYISLFAIVLSGSACITAAEIEDRVGDLENKQKVWGRTVLGANRPISPTSPSLVATFKQKVGTDSSTYAPSEYENILRHTAAKLNELANRLAQLRMTNLKVFNEYFGERSEDIAPKGQMFEAKDTSDATERAMPEAEERDSDKDDLAEDESDETSIKDVQL